MEPTAHFKNTLVALLALFRVATGDDWVTAPSTPYTLHPTPYTLHPTPHTPHPTPYTLHPTPYTLHPTPCTLHPTPYTLCSCFKNTLVVLLALFRVATGDDWVHTLSRVLDTPPRVLNSVGHVLTRVGHTPTRPEHTLVALLALFRVATGDDWVGPCPLVKFDGQTCRRWTFGDPCQESGVLWLSYTVRILMNKPGKQAALMANAAISEGARAISDREWRTFTTLLGTVPPHPVEQVHVTHPATLRRGSAS